MESCPICKKLGKKLSVDFTCGKKFPEEESQLIKVMWFHDWHILKRCPRCGTYYDFTFYVDNDPFSPPQEDTGAYERISKEEAEQMVGEEKARLLKQKNETMKLVRKEHGQIIKSLSKNEMRIVNYLAGRRYRPDSFVEDIAKDQKMDIELVNKALGNLVQKDIVRQKLYGSRVKVIKEEERNHAQYYINV